MQSDQTQTIPSFGNFGNGFLDEDPWVGLKPGDVVRWNNGGVGGLKLELVNALESQWEDIFLTVVSEWDNGNPKTLQLTTSKESHDPECEPIDNKSKVCNSNYGDTQWRGINQVLIQNGYIVATTSKMNEFYLEKSSEAQRRYTMCHEVGHSFGLPHTDEDFFNADLGNCKFVWCLLFVYIGMYQNKRSCSPLLAARLSFICCKNYRHGLYVQSISQH